MAASGVSPADSGAEKGSDYESADDSRPERRGRASSDEESSDEECVVNTQASDMSVATSENAVHSVVQDLVSACGESLADELAQVKVTELDDSDEPPDLIQSTIEDKPMEVPDSVEAAVEADDESESESEREDETVIAQNRDPQPEIDESFGPPEDLNEPEVNKPDMVVEPEIGMKRPENHMKPPEKDVQEPVKNVQQPVETVKEPAENVEEPEIEVKPDEDETWGEPDLEDGEKEIGGEGENVEEQVELDDDENFKNPAYIPRKGGFYQHDSRDTQLLLAIEEKPSKSEAPGRWPHDKFNEDEQGPKSSHEMTQQYADDVTTSDRPHEQRHMRSRPNQGGYNNRRAAAGEDSGYKRNRGDFDRRDDTRNQRPQDKRREQGYNHCEEEFPSLNTAAPPKPKLSGYGRGSPKDRPVQPPKPANFRNEPPRNGRYDQNGGDTSDKGNRNSGGYGNRQQNPPDRENRQTRNRQERPGYQTHERQDRPEYPARENRPEYPARENRPEYPARENRQDQYLSQMNDKSGSNRQTRDNRPAYNRNQQPEPNFGGNRNSRDNRNTQQDYGHNNRHNENERSSFKSMEFRRSNNSQYGNIGFGNERQDRNRTQMRHSDDQQQEQSRPAKRYSAMRQQQTQPVPVPNVHDHSFSSVSSQPAYYPPPPVVPTVLPPPPHGQFMVPHMYAPAPPVPFDPNMVYYETQSGPPRMAAARSKAIPIVAPEGDGCRAPPPSPPPQEPISNRMPA